MRSTTPAYKQEDGVRYHARDMAVVRARRSRRCRSFCRRRRPRWKPKSTPARPLSAPLAARALRRPADAGTSRRSICAAKARRAGATSRRVLPRPCKIALERARAGAAVPQSPRLCAAHALPRLRLPPAMPELRCLAGRAPLPPPARLPPLRLCTPSRRDSARNAARRIRSSPAVPASSGSRRKSRRCFPNARILVLSSDLIASIERMQRGVRARSPRADVDIVIGTQLVAKGHHFPKLNLVGVVDADLGLGQGDPRAAERTFQLLHQVAGRAGREAGQGHGFLQTHQPEHPVIRALIVGDREAFYASEIASARKVRLSAVRPAREPRHLGPRQARDRGACARSSSARRRTTTTVRMLGPAEAPLSLVRGRHRYRLLIKSPRAFDLSGYMRDWLDARAEADAAASSARSTSIRRAFCDGHWAKPKLSAHPREGGGPACTR